MKPRKVKLRDVVEISPGGSCALTEQTVSFIAMADVGEDGSILNVQQRALTDVSKGYTAFQTGDVLLAKITPCFENGKAAVVGALSSTVGFGSTEFHVLRPRSEIDLRFLFHLVWNPKFRRIGASRMTGSAGQKRVPTAFLSEFEFNLPSLDEQKRIAAILDKADSLRRKRQEAICLADDFLRAAFLEMFGNPEVNPHGYRRSTIRELVATANYGTAEKASEVSGEFPILRMNNITYGGTWNFTSLKYVDLAPKVRDKFLARRGDLLFNRTNSVDLVGKTAVFEEETPMAIAGYLVRVRTNDGGDPYYLSGYLNSTHGKSTLKAMAKSIIGMANINAQEMQEIPILIPPIELQRRYGRLVQVVRAHQKTQIKSQTQIEALALALSAQCINVQ